MASQLTCVIVTPETTAFDEPVEFVAVPLFDGEIGILPGHAPLIGRLGYGELRIKQASQTRSFYIDGGFLQVADNVVSILTNRAVPADRVNTAAATAQLEAAIKQPASTDADEATREKQIAQARGQLRVASKR